MEDFNRALTQILVAEGGYYDGTTAGDPNPTNYGITQNTYNGYRVGHLGLPIRPVKDITMPEVEDIYFKYYWLKAGCDKLKWPVSLVVFDVAVNSGVGAAVKLLQKIVGADADGVIGPNTLAAVNKLDPTNLFYQILIERQWFYVQLSKADPNKIKFLLGGWSKRLHDLYLLVK